MKCNNIMQLSAGYAHHPGFAQQSPTRLSLVGWPLASGRKNGLARLGLMLFMCWLLAACAIIPKPPEVEAGIDNSAAWQAHQTELKQLQTWSIQGRVATGQLLGWTGDLSWRQQGGHFDVRLSAPLGAGGFRASGTLDEVTVRTKDRTVRTDDPQQLVRRILGFPFPLRTLRYWARGLPAPGDYDSISVNAEGRLIGLRQQGWQLSYLDYEQEDGQPALPTRIVLENGETRIRMVVARWFNLGD